MLGLMQEWPLVATTIIDHAARVHGTTEIVTRTLEGPIARTTYATIHSRARKVAKALVKLGVKPGDRLATAAWNTSRHVEAWYGILGAGAVCHTVNPRLFADQIRYIVNHAEDIYLFLDPTFVSLFEPLQDSLPSLRGYIILTDRAHMPETALKNAMCFEDFLSEVDDDFRWVEVDERDPSGLCYTSGTTGHPKGVLYPHRTNVIHALTCASMNVFGAGSGDCILPIVPLYHANAWGVIYSGPMVGAKLVLPGEKLDGPNICELIQTEGVTVSCGVPTVWLSMLQHLETTNTTPGKLRRILAGGSACPRMIFEKFEKNYGVTVFQGWGMTEMSPMGTTGQLKFDYAEKSFEDVLPLKLTQGLPIFSVETEIFDPDGRPLPHDGKAFGHLKVRGLAIVHTYFRADAPAVDADGWFDTGDIATIDPDGYMQITDRAKDVIKSGGEWISSIELENLAVGHPDVAEAAVIGVHHPKWDERPLLVIVPKPGHAVAGRDVLKFLEGKIAKWWMPDDVVFVEEMPHTATGKIQKMTLREMFKSYKLPTVS